MHDFSRHPLSSTLWPCHRVWPWSPFLPSARNLSTWSAINLLDWREGERERKEGRESCRFVGKLFLCENSSPRTPFLFFFFYTRNKIIAVAKGLAIIYATDLTGAITFSNGVSRTSRGKSGKERIVNPWSRPPEKIYRVIVTLAWRLAFYRITSYTEDFIMREMIRNSSCTCTRIYWTLRDDLAG